MKFVPTGKALHKKAILYNLRLILRERP